MPDKLDYRVRLMGCDPRATRDRLQSSRELLQGSRQMIQQSRDAVGRSRRTLEASASLIRPRESDNRNSN